MRIRALLLILTLMLAGWPTVRALDIILPTKNDALFTGAPEQFYMHVNRYTDGVQTAVWEGGMYGFVRNPRVTPHGTIYTRFHDGIDIRPLERDEKGNPLDEVVAISAGRVVHTSPRPGASNYGRYVVVEHQWDGCPYYSLYAHLAEIVVELGAQVRQGQKLAVMGYTGRGLDRERAHLHLEVNLLINENFQTLYGVAPGPNQNAHGNFNGANLRGLDVARLYKETRANPKLTIPEFLRQEQPFFHVEIPGSMQIDMLKRYPWIAESPASEHQAPPPAWRIAFAQSGVPLKVERGSQPVSVVRVSVAQPALHPLNQLTRGLLAGTPETAALSKSGQRFLSLLTFEPQQIAVTAAGASGEALPVTDTTHTVKRGETLLSIAKAHKMTPTELQAVNKIKDPKLLQIGQVLVIPGAGDAAAEELGGD